MEEENKGDINIFKPVDKPLVNNEARTLPLNKTEQQSLTEDPDKTLLNWQAAESFSLNKNFQWYLILTIGTIAFATIIFYFTRDKITTGVILIGGLLIGIYGAKKPRIFSYQLTNNGFSVNGKNYQFGSFRSFSVVSYSGAHSIVLTPMKRFMPYMYIYCGDDVEQKLTDALTNVLPRQTSHNDLIDRVLRNIGF